MSWALAMTINVKNIFLHIGDKKCQYIEYIMGDTVRL